MSTPEKTVFKMIPDAAELAGMERDLRFHPAPSDNPRALTIDQVATFNRDGFLRPIGVFDELETASLRRYFDGLLEATMAAGGDSYSISSAHLKYGRVHDLLCDRRIVRLVRDLVGENVIGWGSHFFCKMPGDGKTVTWHQDASYWPLTPSKTVTLWLAIDDADVENACMRFIAGSHLHGHLAYRASDAREQNVLDETIDNPEQFGTVVDNILQAGQISIHSDLLLHASEANRSTRRRCGLTLRYCAADVRAHLDWNQKGVYVSGGDASRHWSNRARPDGE